MSDDGTKDRGAKNSGAKNSVAGGAAAGGDTQVRRAGQAIRWTAAMRDAFFAHLAGSCNITAAAGAIGVPPSQVYYRRKTYPAFAEQWEEAIAIAYQVMETRLIGHVLAGGGATVAAVDGVAPEAIAWDGAIKLLTMHKARREGRARTRGPAQTVATRAQTDAAIIRRLKALAARRQREGAALPALPAPVPVGDAGGERS